MSIWLCRNCKICPNVLSFATRRRFGKEVTLQCPCCERTWRVRIPMSWGKVEVESYAKEELELLLRENPTTMSTAFAKAFAEANAKKSEKGHS